MNSPDRRGFLSGVLSSLALTGLGARARSQPSQSAKRDFRKVAISVDGEGISGVVNRAELNFDSPEFKEARQWMVSDVNAAVEGALQAGATHIEVHDTEGGIKRSIPYEALNQSAYLVKGGNLYFWEYDALDSSFGAAFLIGMHAGPLKPGIMSHYFTPQIRDIRFNGEPVTESHMTVALAAHFGIPTVLVTGDDQVCSVLREWSKGQIETVETKRALAWSSGIVAPLSYNHERIREAASRALKKAPDVALLGFKEPVSVALELGTAEEAKSLSLMPGVRRVGRTGVEFSANNILEAHKTLIAALMILASRLGL